MRQESSQSSELLPLPSSVNDRSDMFPLSPSPSQTPPIKSLLPRGGKRKRDKDYNPYDDLIAKEKYGKVESLGKMTESEFAVKLCPLITNKGHYQNLLRFMEKHKLIISFLVHGNIEMVRVVISIPFVNLGDYITSADLKGALVLSLQQKKYDRFIVILAAREHQSQSGRLAPTSQKSHRRELRRFKASLRGFYETIDPADNMEFKRFLIYHGERLNSEYPTTYKRLCKELVSHFHVRDQDLILKDFLGQPFPFPFSFPFPAKSVADRFLHGLLIDAALRRFLDIAPREAIEEGVRGPDEDIREGLWEAIVEKFPDTDPIFPPSDETLENALKGFLTKEGLEEAWTKKNAPNFEGMVLKRLWEISQRISTLNLLPSVLVSIVTGYAAPTRSSWLGPI